MRYSNGSYSGIVRYISTWLDIYEKMKNFDINIHNYASDDSSEEKKTSLLEKFYCESATEGTDFILQITRPCFQKYTDGILSTLRKRFNFDIPSQSADSVTFDHIFSFLLSTYLGNIEKKFHQPKYSDCKI